MNGHHQPVPETVVKTIAAFAWHHQARGFHQAGINTLHLLQMAKQPIPGLGGIAQFKGFNRAGAQTPLLAQVLQCLSSFRSLQARAKPAAGERQHAMQLITARELLPQTFLLVGVKRFNGQGVAPSSSITTSLKL